MADSRRRTLAASGQQAGSSIPIPSSIARPTGALRQSLAAGAGPALGGSLAGRQSLAPGRSANRASSIGFGFGSSQTMPGSSQGQENQMFTQANREAPSTVIRNSIYSASHFPTMSVSRSGTLKSGQTLEYAPPSERRSSTYRRSTLGGGGMATTPGRLQVPATEKGATIDVAEAKRNQKRFTGLINEFLAANQCPISALDTTGRACQVVFRFLIQLCDPAVKYSYPNNANGLANGKEWEREFIDSCKQVSFPIEPPMSKSKIANPGSSQSLPEFVTILHWLTKLIEHRQAAFANDSELHIPAELEDGIERDSDELIQHAWLAYAGDAYPKFLATDDFEAQAEVDLFWSTIDAGRRKQTDKVAEMKAELEALTKELADVKDAKDPLQEWEDKVATTNRDLLKLNKYNKAIADAKDRFEKQRDELAKARDALVHEEAELRANLDKTKAQVAAQGISQAEILAMTKDRRQLQESLEQTKKRYKQKLDDSLEVEMKLSKELSRAQNSAAGYEQIAVRVGILPVPPDQYEHLNFTQYINSAAENPAPDCAHLGRALKELRQAEKARLTKLQQDDIELKQQIDRIHEDVAEHTEEDDQLVADLAQEQDALEMSRSEFADEAHKAEIQLGQLQHAVTQLSQTLHQPVQQADWRLHQRSIEHAQVAEETTRRRKENGEALTVALEKLIAYKDHCTKQIELMAEIAATDE